MSQQVRNVDYGLQKYFVSISKKSLTCFRQIVLKMNFFSESICKLLKDALLLLHFPRIKPAARMTLQCDALFRFEAQIRFYQKVFSDNTSLFL